MSRAQGPRAERGDATVANAAGRRLAENRRGLCVIAGAGMSRAQGPRAAVAVCGAGVGRALIRGARDGY